MSDLRLQPADLRPGDMFGVPPHGWFEKLACRALGASTFHWGCLLRWDGKGWITSESKNKGTSVRRCDYASVQVYRIRGLVTDSDQILTIHSENGDLPYDWDINVLAGLWFIFTHYLHRAFPVVKEQKEVNCVAWCNLIAVMLGFELVEEGHYPTPDEIEKSPLLEYVGEYQP